MAGRNSFAKLRAAMTPEAQERAKQKAVLLREEMDLAELRKARRLSQEELAQVLNVGQASVAKIEKRADYACEHIAAFCGGYGGKLGDCRQVSRSQYSHQEV